MQYNLDTEFMTGQLYQGVPYDFYAQLSSKISALRSSHLKHLRKSPAHFQASLVEERKETEALRLGKIIHKFLENTEKFMDCYVVEPSFTGMTRDGRESKNSKEAKILRAAWRAEVPDDKMIVTEDDLKIIEGISKAVQNHSLIRNMLKAGMSETSLWVQDPDYNVTLACRPDFIAQEGYIVDIKSTRSAAQEDFTHDIFSDRRNSPNYIVQAAFYARCARIAGLQRPDSFTFIAIEKEPPFGLNVFPMDHACLEVGERRVKKLISLFSFCTKEGKWPCYPQRAQTPLIPQYVQYEDENE